MRRRLPPAAEILLGAIATIVLNVGVMFASAWLPSFFLGSYAPVVFFIGLVQLVYILPICIYLGFKEQWNWMKGIIIGACITALLNGGCWLLVNALLSYYNAHRTH